MPFLFAFLFLLDGTAASAADSVSFTIHHLYQSPRALGMGDAFVAVADDYSALYYNPAGLSRRTDNEINIGLSAAATPETKKFYDDINDIQKSSMSDNDKQTALVNLLQSNYGTTYSARVEALEAIWVRPNWGFGFIPLDLSVEATLHQQIGPAINTTIFGDTSMTVGYGHDLPNLLNGKISWGISGKFINRLYFSQAISASELATNQDYLSRRDLSEGYTVDADLGLLWDQDFGSQHFQFGAVVHNILDLGFTNSLGVVNKDSLTDPENLNRVFDLGMMWQFPTSWLLPGRFVADIRDLNHPDFNWKKGSHVGVELDWAPSSWFKNHFRVGLSETFWTAGFTLQLAHFNFDLVSYAENVGTINLEQESRIYLGKFNILF